MSKKWILVHLGRSKYHYKDEECINSPIYRYAEQYSDGFGMILKNNGHIAYRDMEGNLSEEYDDGYSYSDGYACVRNGIEYAYRDTNGNLSEWFYCARSYRNGFGVIVKDIDRFAFRDKEGNISEEFEYATDYNNDGYAEVKLKNGVWAYRDVKGNLYSKSMRAYRDVKGNLYSKSMRAYIDGKIDETELEDTDFANEKFLDMIIKRTKNITTQLIELAENDEQLQSCKDYYNDTMEYVLSKAYEARNKEMIEKEKAEQLDNEKRQLLKELNLAD